MKMDWPAFFQGVLVTTYVLVTMHGSRIAELEMRVAQLEARK